MPEPVLEFRTFVAAERACHAAARSMSEDHGCALHSHDFHEVFWVDHGRGIHLVNGEERALETGLLVAVAASDVHGFTALPGQTFRLVNVAFALDTWRYMIDRYAPTRGDLMQRPIGEREFRLTASALAELTLVAREVLKGKLDRRAAERFLLNVLYLADRSGDGEFPNNAPRWLCDACLAIRDKRRFVRGTQAFVKLCGYSAEHVARQTRRFLGKTPTDVVNAARLEWAAQRLGECDDAVVDVALECGFGNLAHFYRLFRNHYGTSPAEYRRRQQELLAPLPERRARTAE